MMLQKSILFLCFCVSIQVQAQFKFTGKVAPEYQEGTVYLSIIENYRKTSGIFPEQIVNAISVDSSGLFLFSGSNLPEQNRLYKIHVDTCPESKKMNSHFSGECEKSKEIIFIANNSSEISFPFTFDNQMFCSLISATNQPRAILKIDSLKEVMKYDFSSYPSQANRKLNASSWVTKLRSFAKTFNEPLAELYVYSYISNKKGVLYEAYKSDVISNPYYDSLNKDLKKHYPNTPFAKMYDAEINADRFSSIQTNEQSSKWHIWIILILSATSLFLIIKNLQLKKALALQTQSRQNAITNLTNQEEKILNLILKNKSNKEIANELFISISTVKTHINTLYKKLNVSSRSEVKALYSKNGTGV